MGGIRYVYWKFEIKFLKWFKPTLKQFFCPVKIGTDGSYKSVPIIINNCNRLTMMRKFIASLESRGYRNIYIIDNASTYPPLLEWYSHECPYPVFLMHENLGHLAFWKSGIYKMFQDTYYAYTDSDLELQEDCPDDFMEKFIDLLRRHPSALKAGFSLRIDDLPDTFRLKEEVKTHESQFWRPEKEIEPGVFDAPIDTTFAVYKPYFVGEIVEFKNKYFRTAPPYSARHLPWYIDSSDLSDEEKYYVTHIKTMTHWAEQELSGSN